MMAVECQRAVDVDERGHHRVGLHEIGAEQQRRHIHRILRADRFGDRPHEGLVRQGHVRVQHVQVPLVHRHVGRLAHRAARMVQPFRHVAQFHEVAKIRDGGVTPPLLDRADEGRAVNRCQHKVFSTHGHVAFRVAGVLDVLRRGTGAQAARQSTRDAHPLAIDIGARIAPQRQRAGVIDELHADFLQHRLGVPFDDGQRLFVQHLEIGDVAGDIAGGLKADRRAFRPPRRAAATACPPPRFHHIRHDRALRCLPRDSGTTARPGRVFRLSGAENDIAPPEGDAMSSRRRPGPPCAYGQATVSKIMTQHDRLLIIDFGSQVTQLIARRLRELNVYCEIHPYNRVDDAFLAAYSPKARDPVGRPGQRLLGRRADAAAGRGSRWACRSWASAMASR